MIAKTQREFPTRGTASAFRRAATAFHGRKMARLRREQETLLFYWPFYARLGARGLLTP